MTALLPPESIRAHFIAACRAELAALKPGNVHVHAGGHGMETTQFEEAAEAAAPYIADPNAKVGVRIRRAIEASLAVAGCNTNLGIVLLAAPLAAAAGRSFDHGGLRQRLKAVLDALDRDDAAEAFAAIRLANPGGLGTAEEEDVAGAPNVTFKEAMGLAAGRDRIARAYVTDYADVFEFALPMLRRARREAADPALAVTTLHMALLGEFPDSHVARKYGVQAALDLRARVVGMKRLWQPIARRETLPELLALDGALKAEGLNPGTTADLVVATLFADAIVAEIEAQTRDF